MRIVIFTATWLWALSTYAIEYTATYDMIWKVGLTLKAEAVETLKKNGSRYQMELNAKANIGSASETTNLLFDPNHGWKPLDYSYTQSILGQTEGRQFRFNWNKASLSRLHEPERDDEKIEKNILDPLSFRLSIAHSLRNEHTLPEIFPMLDGNDIKFRKLKKLGAELVETSLGTFTAIKFSLEEQKINPGNTFVFWLAPKLNYQLIKLEKNDKNRRFALKLKAYKYLKN